MFKIILAVATMLVAASQARADLYELTPMFLAVGASGTITTNGTIGVLNASDIIDWNITLQYPGPAGVGNAFTLTSSNSFVASEFTTDLTADTAGLHWNFFANDQQIFDIQVLSIPPSCNCSLVLATDYNSSNGHVMRAFGLNYALSAVPSSDLIGTSVPEPSTWAMMLLGFAGLGFAFRQSRHKVPMA
jgi:hypothetical protein